MKYLSWLAFLKPTFWKVFSTFVVYVLILVFGGALLGVGFILGLLVIPDYVGRLVGFSMQFSFGDNPGDGHPIFDITYSAVIDFLVLYILVCLVITIGRIIYLSRKSNKKKK